MPLVKHLQTGKSNGVASKELTAAAGEPMKLTFPHPGTLLREEFLQPIDLTPYRLAKEIGVPLTRITSNVIT
jgi:hypothetical protein